MHGQTVPVDDLEGFSGTVNDVSKLGKLLAYKALSAIVIIPKYLAITFPNVGNVQQLVECSFTVQIDKIMFTRNNALWGRLYKSYFLC